VNTLNKNLFSSTNILCLPIEKVKPIGKIGKIARPVDGHDHWTGSFSLELSEIESLESIPKDLSLHNKF
jgi:hypothetical protein